METPDIDWSSLIEGQPLKRFCKNQIIFRQETPCDFVYIVKQGRVRLELCGANGHMRSLFVAETGTAIGELSCMEDMREYLFTATASSECFLYAVATDAFCRRLAEDHALSMQVLRLMSKKMRLMSTLIKQISFHDSYYRVAYALLNLVQKYGSPLPENAYKINLKFTHQEMADLTGLSRVSVSNILLDMTAEGLIEKESTGFWIIKRLDALDAHIRELDH